METMTLNGTEYLLIPKHLVPPAALTILSSLQEEERQPAYSTPPQATQSPLSDFLTENDQTPVNQNPGPLELATNEEKETAIRVVDTTTTVPSAIGGTYDYYEKYKAHELLPQDVTGTPHFDRSLLAANPEDPLIKADAQRPADKRLFYGAGTEIEAMY